MYRRRRSLLTFRFLFLAVLLGACSGADASSGIGPVPAGMQVRAQDVHYEVTGATAAREVLRSLRALELPRCETMNVEANALANRILDRYREQNRRYDEETRGGATQGAVWPPRATDTQPVAAEPPGEP